MSFEIEGANSEVASKIKRAEAKLLAKGKAKMPNAKEFKVKMRPNLVRASSGTFYGGHLYGTEDGTKWMKCAEVRIREGKEGASPGPKPETRPAAAAKPSIPEAPKLSKEDIQRRKEAEKRDLLEKKTKESIFGLARRLESEKDKVLSAHSAGRIFETASPSILRTLFKPAVVKSLKVTPTIKNSMLGGAECAFSIDATLHIPFAQPDGKKVMEEHGVEASNLCHIGFFYVFYERMFDIEHALEKSVSGLSKKYIHARGNDIAGLHRPIMSELSGNGVDVRFVAASRAVIKAWK